MCCMSGGTKTMTKNKCRRAGVGNRQNLAWPPELVNFACVGLSPMARYIAC